MLNLNLNKKTLCLSAILILIVGLSWLNFLDKQAYSLNIESLKETSSAFVVMKGFDALTSFAENVPFVGKIISPYDTFIERMSFVMLVSVMSLGLQKIMIITMQSSIINIMITFCCGLALINQYKRILSVGLISRAIVFLVFIRFSIPLMTFTINAIESQTYKIQSEVSQERIAVLQAKINDIEKVLLNNENIEREKLIKINALNEEKSALETNKTKLKKDIKDIKYANKNLLEMTTSMFNKISEDESQKIHLIEKNIFNIDSKIETINKELEKYEDKFFNFDDTKGKLKIALNNLNTMMSEVFDVFITWTVLFFFRNIFFPLLFLWGCGKLMINFLYRYDEVKYLPKIYKISK